MSQLREIIQFSGLITNPSEFSEMGQREFTNVRQLRPGLVLTRPGVIRNAMSDTVINKLFNYDLGQVFHAGAAAAGLLKRWVPSTNAVTTYAGAVNPVSGRLRTCVSAKNLYWAGTVPGKLSGIGGVPTTMGGLFAPGFDRLSTSIATGTTVAAGKSVAYRSLFGVTDAKGNLVLGEVSARMVVTNLATVTVNPTVRAIVPPTATTSHFLQVYRSAGIDSGTQPDDDLQLVYEIQLKSTDITAGYLDVLDVTPDSLRGAFIYTAPNGGETDGDQQGIAASNRAPPSCMELANFSDRTWFANIIQPGEFLFSIIGVVGSAGIQPLDEVQFGNQSTLTSAFSRVAVRNFGVNLVRTTNIVYATTLVAHGYSTGDSIRITGDTVSFLATPPGTITVTTATNFNYAETGPDTSSAAYTWTVYKPLSSGQYLLETNGTVSYNNQGTALNFCSGFNKDPLNTELWAQWVSKPEELDQGRILIRGRTAATGAFLVNSSNLAKRAAFSPVLAPNVPVATVTRVGATVTATVTAHTFVAGESVTLSAAGAGSGGSTFTTGPFVITSITATTIVFTDSGGFGIGTLNVFPAVRLSPTDTYTADVEAFANRVYYSRQQKHEATTRTGWVDVGSADTAILAMKAQRGQLWVWKADGIYRIRGYNRNTFVVEAMDTSLRVLATESVILFDNRCWGLTDRGVVAVSESGLEIMSSAIDSDIKTMAAGVAAVAGPSVEVDCFATAYESARSYILHVPDPLSVDAAGLYGACRYAFVFTAPPPASASAVYTGAAHGSWALWDWSGEKQTGSPYTTAACGKRCAVVGLDDKLYLGEGFVGISNRATIFQERKSATPSLNTEDDGSSSMAVDDVTRTGGTTVVATLHTGTTPPVVGNRVRFVPTDSSLPAGGAGFTDFGPFVVTAKTPTTFTFLSTGSNVSLATPKMVICKPVASAITWLLQTNGSPGSEKRWDEVEVLFAPTELTQAGGFTETQVAIGLTLSNEASTSGSIAVASQGTQVARAWIPKEMARGSRLLVRVTHAVGGEFFALAGLAVKSETLNGAVTR